MKHFQGDKLLSTTNFNNDLKLTKNSIKREATGLSSNLFLIVNMNINRKGTLQTEDASIPPNLNHHDSLTSAFHHLHQ